MSSIGYSTCKGNRWELDITNRLLSVAGARHGIPWVVSQDDCDSWEYQETWTPHVTPWASGVEPIDPLLRELRAFEAIEFQVSSDTKAIADYFLPAIESLESGDVPRFREIVEFVNGFKDPKRVWEPRLGWFPAAARQEVAEKVVAYATTFLSHPLIATYLKHEKGIAARKAAGF